MNLGVLDQLVLFPACKALQGSDPESAVSGSEERSSGAREMLARQWTPWDESHTIEANQAKFRAKPKITVGRLGN